MNIIFLSLTFGEAEVSFVMSLSKCV